MNRYVIVHAIAALSLAVLFGSLASPSIAAPSCASGPRLNVNAGLVEGTECADVIVVTSPSVEKIVGGPGDDIIFANKEVLEVNGGEGDDHIYGEPLSSGAKLEQLSDKTKEPSIPIFRVDAELPSRYQRVNRRNHARLSSVEYGGDGNQTLTGGSGGDWLYGQRGQDTLLGGDGHDLLYGGPGDDKLYGQEDWDILGGGFGEDLLDGNNGSDLVRGDASTDNIFDSGSSGVDTLSYASATAPGFSASMTPWANFPPEGDERGVYVRLDAIPCSGEGEFEACDGDAASGGGYDQVASWQFENVIGSPFADFIVGNAWNNRIDGGGGADVIYGSAGNDVLVGGADGDYIHGDGGTDTAFGLGGLDNCVQITTKVDCEGEAQEVHPRDPSKISVGFMQNDMDPNVRSVSMYLVGSNTHDSVWAVQWWDTVTQKLYISFKTFSDTWAYFDNTNGGYTPGCSYTPTEVLCALPAMIDSLVLAGMGHDDQVNIYQGGFAENTSTVLLGGPGNDSIWGSGSTEDVLIDGDGNDYLTSFGWDDVLVNNGGADTLQGGNGNDLLLSTEICGGDVLHGARYEEGDAAGENSASWAKLPAPNGVTASLESGIAGNYYSSGPKCGFGSLSQLLAIDDLEGSSQSDALYGDSLGNGILGRLGDDFLYGRAGVDQMQAGENARRDGVDVVRGDGGVDNLCEHDSLDDIQTCP